MRFFAFALAFILGCDSSSQTTTTSGTTGGTTSGTTGGTSGAVGQVFPSDNPWNQRVDDADDEVDPRSNEYLTMIGLDRGLHADFSSVAGGNYGIPYAVVPANQPLVPVTFVDWADESDPGPYPIPDDAPVEDGGDRHVIAVDPGNGFLYELYNAMKVSGGWSASNGAKWNLKTGAPRPMGWTSADAAGLPIFAGLVRYDEATDGGIKHAIRFTVSQSQRGYIAPASHAAGSCAINSACAPMGMRVRLKKSIDPNGFSPQARAIVIAMQEYGMIVADNGSNWYYTGAPHPMWDDDQLHEIDRVHGRDFEVLKVGTITPQ